jgi:DNA-binding SARP family transcriptional activator
VRLLIRQEQYAAASQALLRLPESTTNYHPGVAALLRGRIACGLGDYAQASREAQIAIAALEAATVPMELARAYLLQAQIIASKTPKDKTALAASLERVVQIADRLGHDAFLVAETLSMGNVLQCADTARVADWLRRHRDVRLIAQALRTDDRRLVLVVHTFGTDQIVLDGKTIDIGWRKAREVFYYLLAHSGGAASGVLREAIWPDLSAQGSSEALRRAIYRLRAVLPDDMIASHGRRGYRLNREVVRIEYDVEQFLDVLGNRSDDREALIGALELYHGPYLPWSDSSWSRDLRMALEKQYLHALRAAAERYVRANAYLDALMLYQRILMIDQLEEAAHAGIMHCHVALGNRAAAVAQYQKLRRLLDEELGLDPDPEIEHVYRSLLVTA